MSIEQFEFNGMLWNTSIWSPYPLAQRLGYLPTYLSASDPRPAREQFNSGYRQHGGWDGNRAVGRMEYQAATETLHYPGDPVLTCLARVMLREEKILLFPHSWVVIVQPDQSYEAARLD